MIFLYFIDKKGKNVIIIKRFRGDYMKFISSVEKAYNLDIKKERKINEIIKKDKTLNKDEINKIISIISAWSICRYQNASKELYNEFNMLKLASENIKLLLEIFNMNSLNANLKEVLSKDEYEKFIKDDAYRREILYLALLQIINQGGKTYGAEYGLVYAKTFNFDLSTPLHYASYDEGMNDPRLKEYINTYLKLGGSKNVYWLPSYYSENKKQKYNMEELKYVIDYFSIKQYIKK